MNVSRALFLLLLFLPASAFVWVFPSYIVLCLFLGLSILFIAREGLNSFGGFIKTWGVMALFWATLSTLTSSIVSLDITSTQLQEGLTLLIRLLTLFLLAHLLNRKASVVALARAFSFLLSVLFKKKARSISLAILLTASTLARKIESLKRFQSGLKIRFPNKGVIFRLRLLLLRLIEEIELSANAITEAVYLRGIEKEAFWSEEVTLTKGEIFVLLFVFFAECALCFIAPFLS